MPTKDRVSLYWGCQLVGWSLYAAAVAVPNFSRTVPPLRIVVYSACLGVLGLAQTHAFRAFAASRGWRRYEARQLVLPALATSAGMGVVMTAFMVVADVHYFELFTWSQFPQRWPFALVSWVWWFFPAFVGWHALYFGVHFVRRARRADVEKWQLASAAHAAELRFLKAQLNPHFLFNALNSLRGLIAEDPTRAQTMVTQLSGLLRHAMSETTLTVPLARELEVVGDYLALESVRLEERLRIRMDIDPTTLDAVVPAMLVQGLVENAIKHGVALLPEGGELSISTRVTASALEVSVTNPMGRARAKSIAGEGGIGLANTRERLRLLFGEAATLDLDEAPPGCMTARVKIPGAT